MPQTIEKYKIFLASPSDVIDTRQSIEEVITELNNTYGHRANIVLELIKWETHSAPAISNSSVQDIIDSDIGCDYDLFIGILWMKFGTPTEYYESGTEQEFRKAYNRYKYNLDNIQILFYFNTSVPITLNHIDTTQLQKINSFKTEIGKKSVFYWEYNTDEQLKKFLRIHIPKRIDDLKSKNSERNSLSNNVVVSNDIYAPASNNVEELGLGDYQTSFYKSMKEGNRALIKIIEATNWAGNEVSKIAIEIRRTNESKIKINLKEVIDFCRRCAGVFNVYARQLEPQIPIYMNEFEAAADALLNIIAIYQTHFSQENDLYIKEVGVSVSSMINCITNASEGMAGFINAINSLPRMEKELNKARNNVELKVRDFINNLEISSSISQELYKVIPHV